MRKSDKKRENAIVAALTQACENDLKSYQGFQWITHIVDFNNYPESFTIICVFDTNENVQGVLENGNAMSLKGLIEAYLLKHDIKVKEIKRRILFDSEYACDMEFNGDWSRRLASLANARHA